jgi:hypothetical protein
VVIDGEFHYINAPAGILAEAFQVSACQGSVGIAGIQSCQSYFHMISSLIIVIIIWKIGYGK